MKKKQLKQIHAFRMLTRDVTRQSDEKLIECLTTDLLFQFV